MAPQWNISYFEFEGFEWNDEKAARNIQKHHIDFEDAIVIFTNHVVARTQFENGEVRWQALGLAYGRELFVVFTEVESYCRIISARRCTRAEAN